MHHATHIKGNVAMKMKKTMNGLGNCCCHHEHRTSEVTMAELEKVARYARRANKAYRAVLFQNLLLQTITVLELRQIA